MLQQQLQFLLGDRYPTRRPGESRDAHLTRVIEALPADLPEVIEDWRRRAIDAHDDGREIPES